MMAGTDRDTAAVRKALVPSGVWLFQGNPKWYPPLADGLKGINIGEVDSWEVTRYADEMRDGDTVLIWRSGPGAAAGICAVGTLNGQVYSDTTMPEWRKLRGQKPKEKYDWIDYRYTMIFRPHIPRPVLKARDILKGMDIIELPWSGMNFRVSADEWQALQPLLRERS